MRDSFKLRVQSSLVVGLIVVVTLGVPQLFWLNRLLFLGATIMATLEIVAAYRSPSRLKPVGVYDDRFLSNLPTDTTLFYIVMEIAVVIGGGLSYYSLYDRWSITVIIIGCVTCDTCAYCIGKLIGHKFISSKPFPEISPKKTWEGTIGGIICSIFAIALLHICTGRTTALGSQFGLVALFFTGILCVVGDVIASLTKRLLDIKDSSDCIHDHRFLKYPEKIMRGFGGYLDRIDSTCLVCLALSITQSSH